MEEIKIELKKEEALVLFEILSRFSDEEKIEIQNPAEEKVLWTITAMLESILVEPLLPNWDDLLSLAQKKILEGE